MSSVPAGSFHPSASTAERYRTFSRVEARGSSPLYVALAAGVSDDPAVLALLEQVPRPKRQPNLLFASVLYLGGIQPDYPSFRRFVLAHRDEIRTLLLSKSTQTNEVGRCATLLTLLARLPGPLALLEVGASAGLCLLPDRYAYRYNEGELLGDPASPVRLSCRTRGLVPIPRAVPEVVWRRGIDLHPIDVRDEAAVRWLECCVWPDQPERLARLRAAVAVAREEPPMVVTGDLLESVVDVAASAPADATLVVFHSAVLNYLTAEDRRAFAGLMSGRPWVWISNEGRGVVETLRLPRELPDPNCFVMGLGATEAVAFTHPHGRWVEWVEEQDGEPQPSSSRPDPASGNRAV
ncbi:MAG TPA: DUF2332 domain-containing protein [Chloroflexota bacterium]|nr:DUF2332 domain-containing protein [Chloroflexota bacterium]